MNLKEAFTVLDKVDETRRTEAFHLINAAVLNLKFALEKFDVNERQAIAVSIKEIGEKTVEKLVKNETALSFGWGDENFSPLEFATKKAEPSKFATELIKLIRSLFENATPTVQPTTDK